MKKKHIRIITRPILAGLFFILGFSIPAYPGGADEERIWGIPVSSFRERLEKGEYEFLRDLDYRSFPPADIRRAGTGAAFYLSHVFARLGMKDMRLRMLDVQWELPEGVWSREAGAMLLADLIDADRHAEAERLGIRYAAAFPGSYAGIRLLLEALHVQGKDREILSVLEGMQEPPQDLRLPDERAEAPADQELLFYLASASGRLGIDGWRDRFRDLFFAYPATAVHERAAKFLSEGGRMEGFPTDDREAFLGKAEVAKREYHRAADHLDPLVRKAAPQLQHPAMMYEAERAYRSSGKAREGARSFSQLADRVDGEALFSALEISGRLLRSAGAYADSARQLEKALLFAPDPQRFDRSLWYYLSSLLRRSRTEAIPKIVAYSRQWNDAEYFSDLLGTLCQELVDREDWTTLRELYLDLEGYAPPSAQAQYAVVLAAVAKRGALAAAGRDPRQLSTELYRRAYALEGHPYYTLIAAAALGEPFPIENGGSSDLTDGHGMDSGAASGEEQLASGFFRYGLHREGYEASLRYESRIRAAALQENARKLASAGYFLESLRIMNRTLSDRQAPYIRETLELLYPRAFRSDVHEAADRHGLPLTVFYGLVREESYFDPDIVSWAGAIGLTQLMPATARDVSVRMRLKAPDLTDPATNLSIGAFYFNLLLERFERPLFAMIGYNAGFGRIRTWSDGWRHLPLTVFVERIPFLETRHYVRKILVSAAYYGYLYEGIPPEETVRLLFPDL